MRLLPSTDPSHHLLREGWAPASGPRQWGQPGSAVLASGHTAQPPKSTAAETKRTSNRTSNHVDALAPVRSFRSSEWTPSPALGHVVRLDEGPLRSRRVEEPGIGQWGIFTPGTTWFGCGRYLVSFGVLIEVTRPSLISANAVKRLGT